MSRSSRRRTWVVNLFVTGLLAVLAGSRSQQTVAADWPMWRANIGRGAATSEPLPGDLALHWTRELPTLQPAWPEDPRLHFDAVYQPIVANGRMFVASSANDSVTAYDATSGRQVWRYYAGGPVRFAPVAWRNRVYFGADDGVVYCLDAERGSVVWTFRAAPNRRRAIGNDRLISVWPVRGGPVLEHGVLYFTVGVWPFEGTFLYALDAEQGKPVPVAKGGVAAPIVLQDRTPQGYLAISGSRLFVPCGRAVVTCLNRETGNLESYSYSTSSVTNYHVAVQDNWLFHGTINYDTQSKATLSLRAARPVLTATDMFHAAGSTLSAYNLAEPQKVTSTDRRGKKTTRLTIKKRWSAALSTASGKPEGKGSAGLRVMIKAGNRLYGHQGNQLVAIDLPSGDEPAKITWQADLDESPASLLAADGKLFAVTPSGKIHCFARGQVKPQQLAGLTVKQATDEAAGLQAARLIERTGIKDGYCLVVGLNEGRLIEALAAKSQLQIIGVDSDAKRVTRLRQRLDQLGLYGNRVALLAGKLGELRIPPYIASLITSERTPGLDRSQVAALFQTLRPYGGTAALALDGSEHDRLVAAVGQGKLPRAEVRRVGGLSTLSRVGALPGSADWTHEYGDPSNSLMSRDKLVKAPLGVLWFGGPAASGDMFYNRHFWGPSMAVIGGRMFLQGPGKLTAVDVYTGRVLWKTPLKSPENYNPGRRGNNFENKIMGFHFLAVEDAIYLVQEKECLQIDPTTGREVRRLKLPDANDQWGRIRVQGDILLATAFQKSELGVLPKRLVAMNRKTGKVIWTRDANLSFPFVAVSGKRVFCFDGALANLYRDWSRKGKVPKAADIRLLKALDLQTGQPVWEASTDMVVTWLSYSPAHDVLVTSNKHGVAARSGKDGGELWKKTAEGSGFRGHPESYWDKVILWNDRVIDQRGPGKAYDIRTGKPSQRAHPITNREIDWAFTKSGHHCNYAIANPHMLTFRAASAGFCDLDSGNTGRLVGYRSGCRNSLIPAGGVLNSPNMAHGCVCGYSLFTSLALTHLPDNEMWGYSALKADKGAVQRVGINLGAPGDRTSSDGVLWLDYPNVGGTSPAVDVKVSGKPTRTFKQHAAFLEGDGLKWVAASGIEGVQSLSIGLGNDKPRDYTVRLHFGEPEKSPGQRVFDVQLEGQTVLSRFDVAKEAGGPRRAVVREQVVRVAGRLDVRLIPRKGQPLLCGIEIVAVVK